MEFKGTKGKWVLLTGYKSCGVSIGNRSTVVFSNDCEEDVANALLISKAPDMLEMLIELVNHSTFSSHLPTTAIRVKELIKKSTTL